MYSRINLSAISTVAKRDIYFWLELESCWCGFPSESLQFSHPQRFWFTVETLKGERPLGSVELRS